MKTVEDYMKCHYKLEIIESEEGGYAASYPDLKGCVTCSDTLEGVVKNAVDAKRCWIESELERGATIPEPSKDPTGSSRFSLRMPVSLRKEIEVESKRQGVSMNQYCLYVLSKSVAYGQMGRSTGN